MKAIGVVLVLVLLAAARPGIVAGLAALAGAALTWAARILGVVLALIVSAFVRVPVYVAGVPVEVPLLAVLVTVAVAIGITVWWVAWALPRRWWPPLAWKEVTP